jgi:hypothetical protein
MRPEASLAILVCYCIAIRDKVKKCGADTNTKWPFLISYRFMNHAGLRIQAIGKIVQEAGHTVAGFRPHGSRRQEAGGRRHCSLWPVACGLWPVAIIIIFHFMKD